MQPTNPTNDKTSEVNPAILIFARKHGYETAKYNRRWDNFKCYVPILQKGRTACIGLPRMILEDVKTGDIRMSTDQEAMTILWDTQNAADDTADNKTVNDGANNNKDASDSTDNNASDNKTVNNGANNNKDASDSTDNNASDNKDTGAADSAAEEVSPAVMDFAKKHGRKIIGHKCCWRNFNCYDITIQDDEASPKVLPYKILEDTKTGVVRMSTSEETDAIIDETLYMSLNEANIKQVEQLVEQAWPTATDEKRDRLVWLMMAFESPKWVEYVLAAEKNQIAGSDVLLKYKTDLVNAGVRSADLDDYTKIIEFDAYYYQRQVETLLGYLK